jgi:hypothetical protein
MLLTLIAASRHAMCRAWRDQIAITQAMTETTAVALLDQACGTPSGPCQFTGSVPGVDQDVHQAAPRRCGVAIAGNEQHEVGDQRSDAQDRGRQDPVSCSQSWKIRCRVRHVRR